MTLEQVLDELIKRAAAKSYSPVIFMRMRNDHGSIEAIRRLVETSEPQRGFRRLAKLGLVVWPLESAVSRFPTLFTRKTATFARARLDGLLDG